MAGSVYGQVAESASVQNTQPIEEHPTFKEIIGVGASKREAFNLFQVYLDLSERHGWWNLEIVPFSISHCENTALICGHQGRGSPKEYVYAVSFSQQMSNSDLHCRLNIFKENYNLDSLLFAFVGEDSSVVFLRFSSHLIPPDPPEMLEQRAKKRQRKFQRHRTRYVEYNKVRDLKKIQSQSGQESGQCESATENLISDTPNYSD